MIKLYPSFLFFVVLVGCNTDNNLSFEDFSSKAIIEIFNANKIKTENILNFNNNKSISQPQGLWINLISFDTPRKQKCINYKLPIIKSDNHNSVGMLQIVTINSSEKCSSRFYENDGFFLDSVMDLKIYLFENEDIKFNQVKPYHLTFKLKYKKVAKSFSIPLISLSQRQIKIFSGKKENMKFNKFSSPVIKKLNPGLFYMGNSKKYVSVGNLSEDWEDQKMNIDKKCTFGSYQIVSARGFLKVCGINICGKTGAPACVRGDGYIIKQEPHACYDGSKTGFCNEGLNTYCVNDILMCL